VWYEIEKCEPADVLKTEVSIPVILEISSEMHVLCDRRKHGSFLLLDATLVRSIKNSIHLIIIIIYRVSVATYKRPVAQDNGDQ